MKIEAIKAFNDNYIWALINEQSVALVDPGDAKPCIDFINLNNLTLTAILITHHHADHTGGVKELVAACGDQVSVYGPENSEYSPIEHLLTQGSECQLPLLNLSLSVLSLPGHTLDHIAYYSKEHNFVLCGDTLFSGGCGRVFEGSYEQMYQALNKLSELPDNTKIYCTHEYTLANLHFALTVEPENTALVHYFNQVTQLRDNNQITLPTTLAHEKLINPFLRSEQPTVIESAAMYTGEKVMAGLSTFSAIRQWKDNF